jgi:hypothetical protein
MVDLLNFMKSNALPAIQLQRNCQTLSYFVSSFEWRWNFQIRAWDLKFWESPFFVFLDSNF